MDHTELTIHEAALHISQGQVSAVELVKSLIERIESLNSTINAYVTVEAESSLKRAEHIQNMIQKGQKQAISGVEWPNPCSVIRLRVFLPTGE